MSNLIKRLALLTAFGTLAVATVGTASAAPPTAAATPVTAPVTMAADLDNIQEGPQDGPDVGGVDTAPEPVEAPDAN